MLGVEKVPLVKAKTVEELGNTVNKLLQTLHEGKDMDNVAALITALTTRVTTLETALVVLAKRVKVLEDA
jgi:hypothetical protein